MGLDKVMLLEILKTLTKSIHIISFNLHNLSKIINNFLRFQFSPRLIKRRSIVSKQRDIVDKILNELGRDSEEHFDGHVLVDGMWDNPNNWLRYSLFRSALGLAHAKEIGLIGKYNQAKCRKTLSNFGITLFLNFVDYKKSNQKIKDLADLLIKETKHSRDIFKWELPYSMPPNLIYDGILRRQTGAYVDIKHPYFRMHIIEALECIFASKSILEKSKPNLVVLSHAQNFDFGSLAWLASKKNIPVVIIYGEYGLLRFWKISNPNQIYMDANFISSSEIDFLKNHQAVDLEKTGGLYLERRCNALSTDVGGIRTHGEDTKSTSRQKIVNYFNWDIERPIIAVYSMSWFDLPHLYGDISFFDGYDWLKTTIEVANSSKDVNWLFRPHPLEKYYGGTYLSELIPNKNEQHIGIAPYGWNGKDVMLAVDGLVTLYGTAGIEYASFGIPVLAASKGWYHDCGFVYHPKNRDEYKIALSNHWWEKNKNINEIKRRANIFSGWHFCCPDWQGNFILGDDFKQDDLYFDIPKLIYSNSKIIRKEIDTIYRWWNSHERGSHSFKMREANSYSLSNIQS